MEVLKSQANECKATLFAAQSNGDLSTLSLGSDGNTHCLSITSTSREAGGNPSWLNIDSEQRLLYCLDRGQMDDTKGSLNLFHIEESGVLRKLDSVEAPYSGVAAEYLDLGNGNRGFASVSINKSAVAASVFPNLGALSLPNQVLHPISTTIGPIESRQDASHAHHIILDPDRKYFLVPDLGADLIRVFQHHPETFAPFTELAPLKTDAGAGPRHAVFWRSPNGASYLFFNGELNQNVYSYRITYTASGLAWTKVSSSPALGELGETLAPNTAPTSEIAISPDNRFLLVSSRQHSFHLSPLYGKLDSDSISSFRINDDASLSLVQVAPSGGLLPRQFSLNKKGDKLAVGHQEDKNVVVWERNVESGRLGQVIGRVDTEGPVVFVGWDE